LSGTVYSSDNEIDNAETVAVLLTLLQSWEQITAWRVVCDRAWAGTALGTSKSRV